MIGYFNPFEGASIAYGSDITIQMNQSAEDYVITINLINDQGSVISTSSIDLPIESLVKSGRYDSESKTIILVLENYDEIEIPISDLISGLQEEITPQNKLDADLVDDTNSTNKFNINEIDITTTNTPPVDPNTEVWINLGNQTNLQIPEYATDISYSNITTGIAADDVQEAIDFIINYMQPTLTVNIDTGSEVTITNGTTTIVGLASLNAFTTQIPKLGTWSVIATLNGRTTTKNIVISDLAGEYELNLEYFNSTLNITTEPNAEITIYNSEYTITGIADNNGDAAIDVGYKGTYTVVASIDNVPSKAETFTTNTDGETVSKSLPFISLTITVDNGSNLTITDGTTTYTIENTSGTVVQYLANTGTWSISAILGGKSTTETVVVSDYINYPILIKYAKIYGADWEVGSGKVLSRTDDSALFIDPVPYMADGNHPGSSPFDTLYPWSGMVKETIDENLMVRIPKFWYKITKENGHLKFQIADKAVSGFYVSPAHRARGSEPERDYAWIGRYHCDDNYKSTSGAIPLSNITRATARAGCHNLGSEYWMLDFSIWITVWLLYIVEFANWDSQAMIGYNCGNNSNKEASGATDSMSYHTGTIKNSRSTYGVGVQYRWIEDPWGNVFDWCDGITFNQADIYCFEDPTDYSDSYQSTGATLVGTRPTRGGYIQDLEVSTEPGYEWFLYPSRAESYQMYIPDSCDYNSSSVALRVGGYYYHFTSVGLFCLGGFNKASDQNAYLGVRLQRRGEIPTQSSNGGD